MAFVPKTWQNSPSTSTPINAAALVDLETRVTSYLEEVPIKSSQLPSSVVSSSGTGGVAAWAKETAYTLNKLVTSGGITYICTKAHTSEEAFPGAGEDWQVFAASLFQGDPSGATDVGPMLQEAFDANRTVVLHQGGIYYFNTPVFLDSTAGTARYILDMNGASFKFGPNLPSASGLESLAGTKWAFFNNTLRSALSGGVVTTTTATRATGSSALANYPRFLIRNGRFNANGNIIGMAYGNGAATRAEACFPENIQALISWVGSADLTSIADIDCSGHTPVGGELPTQLIYQRAGSANGGSGDGVSADRVKGYGATVMNLEGCNGFRVASPVSGQYKFSLCQGVIEAGHEETNEISTTAYSVFLDRTKLTYIGSRTNAPHEAAFCTVKVEDTAGVNNATRLDMIDHIDALTVPSGAATRAPAINIAALNKNGYVRLSGCKGVVYISGGPQELQPEGLLLKSSIAGITTAIAEGIDRIASGNFELCYENGAWVVRNLNNNAPAATKTLTAPSFALAAGPEAIKAGGSLVEGQQYEYVMAVKRANGLYTALSATAHTAATSTKNIALAITNPSTPCVIAIWRYAGEGKVTTTPDHYIEIPLDGNETTWYDEGNRVNGRAWSTAGIPEPNAVKETAPPVEVPVVEQEGAPIIVTKTEELTVPAWAHHAQIVGVSGGAGGGGGGSAKTAGGVAKQVGGSGGASATPAEGLFAVTPGAKLKLVVGKGIAGGAGGEANEHAGASGEAAVEGTVSHTSGAATLICSTPAAGAGGAANSEASLARAPAVQNGGSTIPGSSGEGKSTNGQYGLRGIPFQAPGGDSGFPASATEGGKGGQNKGATGLNSAYANQNPGNSYTGTTAGGEGIEGSEPGEGGGGGGGGAPGGAGGKGGKGANGQFWVMWLP